MFRRSKAKLTGMEWYARWGDLATYNAEVSRGLVHTPEWKAKMAEKQKQYNEEAMKEFEGR